MEELSEGKLEKFYVTVIEVRLCRGSGAPINDHSKQEFANLGLLKKFHHPKASPLNSFFSRVAGFRSA